VVVGRPNILFFHVDNLGFGELSCYSGGPFRGATTSRTEVRREGATMGCEADLQAGDGRD